eukprot:CAMPEP_0170418602 /NCGR_PEP_ID=MMETSP0117_2-20130122/34346_1 /TAXON_ID=400756 /ORGANISM="Durinskia baltica, Strain CSIRO CS-38" /LENGTH=36 /DNA_ID= /DNA_START= /DNA_END= /DNA_ORIENTATION=
MPSAQRSTSTPHFSFLTVLGDKYSGVPTNSGPFKSV